MLPKVPSKLGNKSGILIITIIMRLHTKKLSLTIKMADVKRKDTSAKGKVSSTTVMICNLRINERN
jgi:hypothetical protein